MARMGGETNNTERARLGRAPPLAPPAAGGPPHPRSGSTVLTTPAWRFAVRPRRVLRSSLSLFDDKVTRIRRLDDARLPIRRDNSRPKPRRAGRLVLHSPKI